MLSRVKEGFKSTVSNIGSALSNPLMREYEIGPQVGSAGSALSWKVYEGKKRSTGQEVSIWIFEKRQFDKMMKRDQQIVFETLKRGVQQQTRLRHPKLLIIEHGIEDSRDSLAFATEPVFASLSNVLGSHFNLPSPVPEDLKQYELFETELKYGLLQITEALMFLHNDVKMVHGNFTPDNVVLNKMGAWKLFGLDCCMPNSAPNESEPQFSFRGWDPDTPLLGKPSLDFLAPEYVLRQSADRSSDMFSLGMLFYTVFNRGRPLYECDHVLSTFQKNVLQLSKLNNTVFKCLPEEVLEHVRMLLSPDPDVRPDADQLSKIPFFQDVGAATLQYLDSLYQWDKAQRTSFYKGLKKVLEKLPDRILLQRVLPSINPELSNKEMVLFVLPNVLYIAERVTKEQYIAKILPQLKSVFLMEEPIHIVFVCVQKMEVLMLKTPIEDVRSHLFPMLYRALDSTEIKIQELSLKVIPSFAHHVDFPTMKNQVIPRLKKMCLHTSLLSIRVNSLVCLGKLLEYLDRWYVQDEILPFTAQIPSQEPAVLMAILGIYQVALTHKKLGLSKDVMATRAIPYLLPLSIDNQLNLSQFTKFMNVIKEMLNRVETEHTTKLEQVSAYQKEQDAAMQHIMNGENSSGSDSHNVSADSIFSSILDEKNEKQDFKKITQDLGDLLSDGNSSSPGASLPGSPRKGRDKNLTIEQKQKLMKDKQMMEKLEKQGPLEANKVQGSQKQSSKPVNLTNSLASSNLAITAGPTMNFNQQNTTGRPNYSVSMTPGLDSAPMNMGGKPNYMVGPQPESSNALVLHPNSQNRGGFNNFQQAPPSQQQPFQSGPSSLDSLNVLPQTGASQFRGPQPRAIMGAPGMGGMPGQSPNPGMFPPQGQPYLQQQNMQMRPLAAPQFTPGFMSQQQTRPPHMMGAPPANNNGVTLSSNDIDSFLS